MSQPYTALQKHWRRRVFGATWFSYFGYYFGRKPFFIVKSSLETEYAWDTNTLGTIGTAYLLSYAIAQFVSGYFGDRYGARVLLLMGMGLSVLCNIAFGFSNSTATFALFLALNGLAQGTGWSGNVGAMASWFHRKERGTVMGLWGTNYQLGGVLANALGAFALAQYGFRYAFFAGGAVLMLTWFIVLLNLQNTPADVGLPPITDPDEPITNAPVVETGWSRQLQINIALVGGFYFFIKFIRYALWSWTPYLLTRTHHLSEAESAIYSTIFDVMGIGGVIICGYCSDRFFNGRRVKISLLFVGGLFLSCLGLYYLGQADLLLFSVFIGLIGFSLYGPDALMSGAGAMDVGSAKKATLAAGVINGMGSFGAVAQEKFLGYLLMHNPSYVFLTLITASVLAAVFLLILLYRNARGLADM